MKRNHIQQKYLDTQVLHGGINTEKLWTQIIPNLWDYTICMGVGRLTICNRVKYFGTSSKYSLWHNGITFVICLLECACWHVALRYSWHKYMKDSPFKIWGHICRWLSCNFQALERNKWKYSRTLYGYWVFLCNVSQLLPFPKRMQDPK